MYLIEIKFPAAKTKKLSNNLPQGDGEHQEVF